MNYATQYHIGNNQHTRKETAKAIASTVGRVRPLDATTKRRKRGTKRQTAVRTDSHVANGLLKCTFLPKLAMAQPVQACKNMAKTERDFYQSLSNLAEHYRIEPMSSKAYPYPYNLTLAMWDLETQLKRTNINSDNLQLVQDSKKTYFISEERYDTGTTLYYIPVVPLYTMLHDKKRKHTAQLLLSVCCYLYHVADIPYYRQENSYMYWTYEMHRDWIEQDEETDATETYVNELNKADFIGDRMERKLFSRKNLDVFEQRLSGLACRDTFDNECHRVACDAFALYKEYPQASVFRNAPVNEQDPYEDDYDKQVIGMEKYISFIADTKGWLYESLIDSINNEFNEYGGMEEPSIIKPFDGSANITTSTLDFENRLFALLDDLCGLLYDYKTIKK